MAVSVWAKILSNLGHKIAENLAAFTSGAFRGHFPRESPPINVSKIVRNPR
jgi:hypothetical protein